MSSSNKILDAFKNLSYDSVLDSDTSVKAWIQSHNDGCFLPFINGSYLKHESLSSTFSVINPFTSDVLAKLYNCNAAIVDLAVKAAKDSFSTWNKLSFIERGKYIYNIARNVQKHLTLITLTEALNTGRTTREIKDLDVATAIKSLYYYAGSCALLADGQLSSYEALGVVAIAVVDATIPFLTLASKVSAALVTGNTLVLVANRQAPLSAFMLLDICVQSGIPSGVLNLVMSDDDSLLSETIVSNSQIDGLSFDGSTSMAQDLILKKSFNLLNRKSLFNLSGKSSLVIYESADIDSAIECVVDGCFHANGQHPYSVNKVLVQESVLEEVHEKIKERFNKIRVGNHLDKCNDFGPQNDFELLKKLYKSVGAENLIDKNVFKPLIINNTQVDAEFYLNEPNGPYVILSPFRTVKESIELINTSKYGSAVSLWSENISLVMEVAYSVQVGTVWINSVSIEKGVETRKMSGNYHVRGKQSLLNFLKPKWQKKFYENLNNETLDKLLKSFGTVSSNATMLPLGENLSLKKTYKLYIGGKQVRPDSQSSICVYDGDRVICLVGDASRKDVRNAVEASASALVDWKKRTNHNKSQIIYFFGENLSSRREEFISNLEKYTKKTRDACEKEFDLCLSQIFYYASSLDKYIGRMNDTNDTASLLELEEPLGIVACICGSSTNPLLSFISQAIGAISNGNAVIMVPDSKCPMPALDLYEVMETSDMPGVVNILSGNKHILAKYLTEHQQVNTIWYTANELDLDAIRFIRYTSNFSMKSHWISNNIFNECDMVKLEKFLFQEFSTELKLNSIVYKYIHIPMGTIFAN